MPPVGFEPTISAGERPQTYALERAATGTGSLAFYTMFILLKLRVLAPRPAPKLKENPVGSPQLPIQHIFSYLSLSLLPCAN
jgi:hypothetical protein